MIRFFTDPMNISAQTIRLSADDSAHIRALRLKPDERFIVCDGDSTDYICKLSPRDGGTTAQIVKKERSRGEPTVECRVYMAFSKGDRLDYAVQKSVELGAVEMSLFESERCVSIPRDIQKKTTRLQRIALETAKLCNRGIIPAVSYAGAFEEAVSAAADSSAQTLFFYECEDQLQIKEVLESRDTSSVSIITGPEGGFEPHEAELVRSKGIQTISLGPRILRSETAPVIALAAVMYQTGNL